MYLPDKIEKSISRLERLADKGGFDDDLYLSTAEQCSYIDGDETKRMYTRMLDLLVALSSSVRLGFHDTAEGIRLLYNAECGGKFKIDTDRAFSILEEAAFTGKWSGSLQECITKTLNLDDHAKMDYRTRRNRDRMHDLTTAYSLLLASKDDSSLNARALVAMRVYVDSNPSSKDFLPDDLRARVFPEEFMKANEGKRQTENSLNKDRGAQ
jgi:hypothetical protein